MIPKDSERFFEGTDGYFPNMVRGKIYLLHILSKKKVMVSRAPIIKLRTSIFERWYLSSQARIYLFFSLCYVAEDLATGTETSLMSPTQKPNCS